MPALHRSGRLVTPAAEVIAQILREISRIAGLSLASGSPAKLIWHLIGQARSQLLGSLGRHWLSSHAKETDRLFATAQYVETFVDKSFRKFQTTLC